MRRAFRSAAPGTITGFDVGGYGNPYGAGDPRNGGEHFFWWNFLAVRISQRSGDSGAGGRHGAVTGLFNNAGAGHVPDVGQNEHIAAAMQG